MNKNGDIIVIEDDPDDRDLFEEIFKKLNVPNSVKFFYNGETALQYLEEPGVEPFLIMSDINLPKLNGFELRERVFTNKELSKKCIPYIFFTTSASKEAVTNVVRHAKASSAWIRLRLEPSGFVLEIEDNGRGLGGLDPDAAQRRKGLKNMRKRMEDVGGSFELLTGPEGGALVRLTVPLSRTEPLVPRTD